MRRKPIGWRRWIVCIGSCVLGLMFLAMAASAFVGGVMVVPGSRHFYGRPWTVARIETPGMQAITGAYLSILGIVFVGLGYKALGKKREPGP